VSGGLVALAIVLGAAPNGAADFAADFQEAERLFDRQEYEAAALAFERLAAAAPNSHGQAASISFAARCRGRLKQVDRALEAARTIEAGPLSAYTRMEILADNKRYRELIADFKDEPIADWPDRINYLGFALRAGAYIAIGDRRAAIADGEQCVELAGSDVWVKLELLNQVASQYGELGDDAKALAVYRRALAIYEEEPARKGRWLYPQALLGAARIQLRQGKHGEASAILAQFGDTSAESRRNVWAFLELEAYGDIHADQGRKADALAKYEDATTISTHQSYLDRVQEKIEALKSPPPRSPQ